MTSVTSDRDFDDLLLYLKNSRGFDFTAYKRTSLMRRVQRRMQALHIERFAEYTEYLEVHPKEFGHLCNVILINVTSFFRDAPAARPARRPTVSPSASPKRWGGISSSSG